MVVSVGRLDLVVKVRFAYECQNDMACAHMRQRYKAFCHALFS